MIGVLREVEAEAEGELEFASAPESGCCMTSWPGQSYSRGVYDDESRL